MQRASKESHTKRLSGGKPDSPIRAEREPAAAGKKEKAPLWTRALDKLGFETDQNFRLPDLSPANIWNGTKNTASDVRTVMASKPAAYDKPLFIIIMVLVIVGFIMMSSASYAYAFNQYKDSMHFISKQFLYTVPGILVMVLFSAISPEKFKGKPAYVLWIFSLVLLVVVLFMEKKNGVSRWIIVGPINFQPSEFAKFTAILVCATYIACHYKEINMVTYKSQGAKKWASKNAFRKWFFSLYRNFQTAVWPFLWRILPILALLIKEPHLSCTIIILLIVGTMMFLGGTRWEYFFVLFVLAVLAVFLIVVWGVVPYGRTRFEIWMDPFADVKGDGWQNVQSLYAISSGGIFGAGFGNSRQKYMYISEPQNDFIFAVICEELGLVGAIVIILIFVAFIWRGFALSLANPDRFQKFVGIGITAQIGYQMILNVAVVTNLVPNTGISLPFFSSGGTSILMLLAEMGVLLAISRSSPNKII